MTDQPEERDVVRAARLDSLSVLLTRIANGRTLTPEEARLLVQHVGTEAAESTTARAAGAEADRLRADIAADREQQWPQRLGQAEKRIKAAVALHQPMQRGPFTICAHCSGWDGKWRCLGVVTDYPCPTITALADPKEPTP